MSINKFKLGVVGGGFVGGTCKLFESEKNEVKIFDLDSSKCSEGVTCLEDLKNSDLIFIAVPTPMIQETGECYTGIVEKAINQVKETLGENIDIVIRSTVPIGFSKKNNVMMIPEFLTEAKPKEDFLNCKHWYIGINNITDELKNKFETLFINSFPNTIREYLTTDECEMIKHFRNTFLATKISFCNEMYSFCKSAGLEYDKIRYFATQDNRIGNSHTSVPGPDGSLGFSGHCLPKDLNSLIYQGKKMNLELPILQSVKIRNETIDRPEKDWSQDKGRAVV